MYAHLVTKDIHSDLESGSQRLIRVTSWVMLHERDGFVRLPNERMVYSSPPRTTLALTPPSGYKGSETLSIQSGAGSIHLTNQRV